MVQYLIILFEIVAIIHMAYQVYFIIGLQKIKPVINQSHPGISIVIASRNEIENLKILIPALFDQKYSRFEVIVAINNSFDESFDYLKSLQQIHPSLKIVNIDRVPDHVNSKKYAITLGIKAAKNKIILLTDADCLPGSQYWIKRMANAFKDDKQFVIGFSSYTSKKGLLNKIIQFETGFSAIQYISAASNGHPYMGVGRNLAYKKKLFLDNNGFNGFLKITGGDDDLFVNRYADKKNTSVVLENDANVVSAPEITFKNYLKQKVRHLSVGKYYTTKSRILLGIYLFTHFSLWIFFIGFLFFLPDPIYFTLTFITAYVPFLIAFEVFKKKSGVKFPLPLTIIIDVVFLFFYIFVVSRVLFTKRIAWTN